MCLSTINKKIEPTLKERRGYARFEVHVNEKTGKVKKVVSGVREAVVRMDRWERARTQNGNGKLAERLESTLYTDIYPYPYQSYPYGFHRYTDKKPLAAGGRIDSSFTHWDTPNIRVYSVVLPVKVRKVHTVGLQSSDHTTPCLVAYEQYLSSEEVQKAIKRVNKKEKRG